MEGEEEQMIRDELSGDYRYIQISRRPSLMVKNIDSFLALSREKTSVEVVALFPFDSDAGNYKFWDKVGQIVGNLTELKEIHIHFFLCDDDDGDEARMPDWETLTRIFPYLRHKVSLCLFPEIYDVEVEHIQGLARAIHSHPMISEFDYFGGFTSANIGPWCSLLATLPSLERVKFGFREPRREDQLVLVNLEPLKELLRTPALRFVRFDAFYFTDELCHVTANALEKGSSIIEITFESNCSFTAGGRAIIATALKRNTSVTDVQFYGHCDEPFCDTLAAVLLCNSTLQKLQLPEGSSGRWLSSIFLSFGMNTTLKSLSVGICDEFGDELCLAIRNGLAKNSTLEELSLDNMVPNNDDGAVSARNALSFLRTNSTLKSLAVSFAPTQEAYYVSAFRLEAVKMMEENLFLESLTIKEIDGYSMKVEELLAVISALQLNTALKTLGFRESSVRLHLTDDEVNQLVPVLMKNFGLERILPDISCSDDGTIKAILKLNAAGRRYLIKDGSSISKGVDVLSAVSDEIDCVFLHLLENPCLCNRKVAETTTGRQRSGANIDESSSAGKRERALSLTGKEPRRRLA
jgi:hypothetical protein